MRNLKIKMLRQAIQIALVSIFCAALFCGLLRPVTAQTPTWLNTAVIYCVNPEIFSPFGLKGVTAQIPRLKSLGVSVIWLMPISPRGQACTVAGIAHPTFDSPYCISNFQAVNPNFGTPTDLTDLITTAHHNGIKVILDAVCNHTSWDNPLITMHPEYYMHSDGNPTNVASIEKVGSYADVAQLNYKTTQYGLQTYMTSMLIGWLINYDVDGFRFDYADNPVGSGASIPKSFWVGLRRSLERVKPNVLMLGEEEDVNLAATPFQVDYGWNMYNYGPLAALTHSLDATTLHYQWQWPYTIHVSQPAGMKHLNMQDNWDQDRDIVKYGGAAQAMVAAVFNFTIDGIPLLYNGMEVGNSNGGVNPHTQISWSGPNATAFTKFYMQLLKLRNGSRGVLQQGGITWVKNSAPSQVSSYSRGAPGNEYLIELNTAASVVRGTLSAPPGGAWTDVTPAGAPGGTAHVAPPNFLLKPYDFAIFHRGSKPAQRHSMALRVSALRTALPSPSSLK